MFGAVWLAAALAVSRGERCSRAVTRTHPASYSDPDLPVLIDLYDVVVSRSAVTVHCPDAASRVAIREVGGALTAKMLRSTAKGAPELRLEVVDAAMPDASARACDARAHYVASIGSWANLWHGATELVAIAGHVLTTAGCGARCVAPGGPAKALHLHSSAGQTASGVPSEANPVLRLVLERAVFGEGRTFNVRGAGGLLHGAGPDGGFGCVAGLHFGVHTKVFAPLRTQDPYTEERRVVVDAVARAAWRACGLRVADRDGPAVDLGNASAARALPPAPAANATPAAVFVARKPEGGGRHLNVNAYAALAAAFARAGVRLHRCCDWSAMSVCEQVELFARADVLVGMHGAGLTNAFLSPRGAVMVELKARERASVAPRAADGSLSRRRARQPTITRSVVLFAPRALSLPPALRAGTRTRTTSSARSRRRAGGATSE